mmetsp:Transcript_800/g.2711  ORF Transcript_800/g.2711 Transcript_800/m.2711 type:complete len:246 (+) Transcript_800:267-1004(+)
MAKSISASVVGEGTCIRSGMPSSEPGSGMQTSRRSCTSGRASSPGSSGRASSSWSPGRGPSSGGAASGGARAPVPPSRGSGRGSASGGARAPAPPSPGPAGPSEPRSPPMAPSKGMGGTSGRRPPKGRSDSPSLQQSDSGSSNGSLSNGAVGGAEGLAGGVEHAADRPAAGAGPASCKGPASGGSTRKRRTAPGPQPGQKESGADVGESVQGQAGAGVEGGQGHQVGVEDGGRSPISAGIPSSAS